MPHIERRSLARFYGWLRHIKTWQLVVILVLSCVVAASLLRMNNLKMDELRAAVQTADKQGDAAKIKQSLIDLQQYVAGHMNTSLGGGLYLEQSYNRDRDKALDAATNSSNPKSAAYQQASIECRSRFVNTGRVVYSNEYVACVVDKLKSLGASQDPQSRLTLPTVENYHYNFTSPFWSADLAGFATLFCALITSVIVLRILAATILRFILKHRFKSI